MPGEAVYRSPAVTAGYYHDEDATREAFRHGWFHSGDSCAYEPDGQQVLVDRYKDIVKSGGENVSSARVEGALVEHPAVARVAVIGIPHERWGEIVAAVVVARPDVERPADEELIAFARERLAGYETPKQIIWVDELPETVGGKVLKYKLRERYAAAKPSSARACRSARAAPSARGPRRRRRAPSTASTSGRQPVAVDQLEQPGEVARAAHRRAQQRELAEVERPHADRGACRRRSRRRRRRRPPGLSSDSESGQVEPTESTTRSAGSSCSVQSGSV